MASSHAVAPCTGTKPSHVPPARNLETAHLWGDNYLVPCHTGLSRPGVPAWVLLLL